MLTDVSDATFRVELSHNPTDGSGVQWTARVYTPADGGKPVYTTWRATRDAALDDAEYWIGKSLTPPDPGATVYFDAKGKRIPKIEEGS